MFWCIMGTLGTLRHHSHHDPLHSSPFYLKVSSEVWGKPTPHATHQTMRHPLHPQSTNHSTLLSKKTLLICPSPMTSQLNSTPHSRPPKLTYPPTSSGTKSRIGKTHPEDVLWRLVPHPSDLLCHPEQADRVVNRSGHVEQMGKSDSKMSMVNSTPTSVSPRTLSPTS